MRMINLGSAALLSAALLVPAAAWAGAPPNIGNRWNQTANCADNNNSTAPNENDASIEADETDFSTSGQVAGTNTASSTDVQICYSTEFPNKGSASNAKSPTTPTFKASSNQKKGSFLEVAIGNDCSGNCFDGSTTNNCVVHTARPEKGKVKGSAKEKGGIVTCKASAKFTLDGTTNVLAPALDDQDRIDVRAAFDSRKDVNIKQSGTLITQITVKHKGTAP